MNPQISAALIAAGVSIVSLTGTVVVAVVGLRTTRSLSEKTLAEQRLRTLNERFDTATDKLGSDKSAAVQLAGVHAIAGLADDWKENRQTCIDVLCAYLRIPYEPDPGKSGSSEKRLAFQASREVRHTVIRIITAHLQEHAPVSWQGINFDFTSVVFDGGSFDHARFYGAEVSFAGAVFSGEVSFVDALFSGGTVSFDDARFSGDVRFWNAVFSDGTVRFRRAEFSAGEVSFDHAVFSGGTVSFYGARFSGGEVRFNYAVFSGDVRFLWAKFSGSTVDFEGAMFSGGEVYFGRAEFSSGTVSFGRAEFSGANVNFGPNRIAARDRVTFYGPAFFSGGEVDFSDADWSHPPKFDFEGTPPAGLRLPATARDAP